jgi:hypothetical protein
MKSLRHVFAAFAALCLVTAALAADPSGNWKVTTAAMTGGGGGGKGGGARESTLTLAMKDGKLTGSMVSPGRGGGDPTTTEVSDASMKDDMVSFSIERDFNGTKFVSKYTGKLDGDTIKGSVESPGRDGSKRDFSATRSK